MFSPLLHLHSMLGILCVQVPKIPEFYSRVKSVFDHSCFLVRVVYDQPRPITGLCLINPRPFFELCLINSRFFRIVYDQSEEQTIKSIVCDLYRVS